MILILKAEYGWMEYPHLDAGTSEAGNSMTLNHNIIQIIHSSYKHKLLRVSARKMFFWYIRLLSNFTTNIINLCLLMSVG